MGTKTYRKKKAYKKWPVMPARLPGLNFDTFEGEAKRYEGAYGTDRAPTYQSRYQAEHPYRYVQRMLDWLRLQSGKVLKKRHVRRARGKSGRGKRGLKHLMAHRGGTGHHAAHH